VWMMARCTALSLVLAVGLAAGSSCPSDCSSHGGCDDFIDRASDNGCLWDLVNRNGVSDLTHSDRCMSQVSFEAWSCEWRDADLDSGMREANTNFRACIEDRRRSSCCDEFDDAYREINGWPWTISRRSKEYWRWYYTYNTENKCSVPVDVRFISLLGGRMATFLWICCCCCCCVFAAAGGAYLYFGKEAFEAAWAKMQPPPRESLTERYESGPAVVGPNQARAEAGRTDAQKEILAARQDRQNQQRRAWRNALGAGAQDERMLQQHHADVAAARGGGGGNQYYQRWR
jgi:hypothetical protein